LIVLRRRRVRVHQADPGPTIEGFLVSSWGEHYRLLRPVLWEAPGRSHELDHEAWIPKARVLFIETVR
jgi:hypothetical protein